MPPLLLSLAMAAASPCAGADPGDGRPMTVFMGADHARATDRFRTAPYLTAGERRDILVGNAVRLFGWSDLAACGGPS